MLAEDIIANLKTSHQAIVNEIDSIQSSARSYTAVKPHLREMSKILLAHFSRQNDPFFDKLRQSTAGDRQAAKMIEFLSYDTKDIKIKFLVFFDRYSGDLADIGSRTFPKDFTDFAREILSRVRLEEDYLFPLIARLPAGTEG